MKRNDLNNNLIDKEKEKLPKKTMSDSGESKKIWTCEACSLSTTTKFTFERHCSSKKCRANHGEVVAKKEKKPTKKELAALAAAEVAAAELAAKLAAEQAAQVARELAEAEQAAKLATEQAARDAELAAIRAQLEQEKEINRLREIAQVAAALEASKTPMDRRRESWAAASALTASKKASDKQIEKAQTLAYKTERDALRAAALANDQALKAAAKLIAADKKNLILLEKKEEKLEAKVGTDLEKATQRLQKYIASVCDQEEKDIENMSNAPNSLLAYASSVHRISHYKSAYYGYISQEFKELMILAQQRAMKCITDELAEMDADPNPERDFITRYTINIDTIRGKKQLSRISDFHESFLPKPWRAAFVKPDCLLKKYNFYYNRVKYLFFYDPSTMLVYDEQVTTELGRIGRRDEPLIVFSCNIAKFLGVPPEKNQVRAAYVEPEEPVELYVEEADEPEEPAEELAEEPAVELAEEPAVELADEVPVEEQVNTLPDLAVEKSADSSAFGCFGKGMY